MQAPLEITFRGMSPSPAVEANVKSWAGRLGQTFGSIQRCSVVIELPHRHQRHGHTYHVHLELAVPDRTIVVTRDNGLDASHEDVYVAIADAFRAARRQLHDHAEVRRGDVKQHASG